MFSGLLEGFQSFFTFDMILLTVVSVVGGYIVGFLPGLTATMAVAILVPLSFSLSAEQGLLILAAVFISAVQGGSVSAILWNTPGTPASAALCFDGYSLTKKGMAGRAIGMAQISAFCGLMVSWLFLVTLSPIIAKFALKFSAPEYFAISVFGLSVVAVLCSDSLLKGVISALLGVLTATIGMDPINGISRYTGDTLILMTGISYVPALIGLFAISEVFRNAGAIIENPAALTHKDGGGGKISRILPTMEDIKYSIVTIFRSSLIGTFIGSLPGTGADIASFVSYGEAKRWAKNPDEFGKGDINGVAAPQAGANGVCGGAFIPMLTLGIPGDAVTAIILGALIIWGLQPGPNLFVESSKLVNTLFAGFFVASIVTLLVGLGLANLFVKIDRLPKKYLLPCIFLLCCVGSYAIQNSIFDVFVAFFFGIAGFILTRYGYQGSPFVLGMILGPMIEQNLRRSLIISNNDPFIFFTRPISLTFLFIAIMTFVLSVRNQLKKGQI
ncbi:tripartite tricarboxylate transporter permease [Cloacibacillus porcorum]